ncbi:MAG: ABC transporter ATP-binding protein [Lachnospiraceae bacterium]|nr:ABC transporter ATP-binding protein [Lachnospiraceae bacterium]
MSKQPRQKLSSILKNNLFMLKKVARYTPDYFFWMIVEGVVWGTINSASGVFSFHLLNTVEEGTDFPAAAGMIGLMALFYIVVYAFDRWYWQIQNPLMRQKLHLKMHEELFVKARSLDLSCFDDPEFYNDFVWAMDQSDKRAVEVLEDTGKLINRIVASTTLVGLLLTVDPVISVILFSSSAITIVCNLVGNKISFRHSKETNPLWRKKDYINRVYHLADYAKELRISRADELLMKEYDENTEKIIEVDVKYGKKYFLFYGLGWNALSTVTFFTILVYMIVLLDRGELAIGGFAAVVTVIWKIRWMLIDLIERLTKYPKHSLYIEKYLEFLRFTPRIQTGKSELPPFESLEFRNVSFSYEFSAHPKYQFHEEDYKAPVGENGNREALRNINLTIHAGEKIAIVGYNGAGKTTLIKLMMRLYDPTEGEILYNGVNIKEYDPEAYRKAIGTVFQDYKIFATTVAENVMNGAYCEERDGGTVINALNTADFADKLGTLKEGIHTHLTREFNDNGTNLSGGESQKVAIARVFAKDYPIIIMDEPSSALDPMAEYNLNQSILHHTNDKTVIFISHRLSTTRIADTIYMFDTGRLIEEGSHSELLARNGKYAEMFRLQSEKYQVSL